MATGGHVLTILGGQRCQDAEKEAANCERWGYPTDWFGRFRPNSFVNPRGVEPGRGAVLLSRAQLSSLNLNRYHDLTFRVLSGKPATSGAGVTLKELVCVPPFTCLTPGREDDPAAVYLVPIADKRHLAKMGTWMFPGRMMFNVRALSVADEATAAPRTEATYYKDTTNSGTDWTWATAAQALWADIITILGTKPTNSSANVWPAWPGLAATPSGKPEDLDYRGWGAWDALCDLLARIGQEPVYNLFTDTLSIVQTGAADADLTAKLATKASATKGEQAYDAAPVMANLGLVPAGVWVWFRRRRQYLGTEKLASSNALDNDYVRDPYSVFVSAASLGYTVTGAVTGAAANLKSEFTVRMQPVGYNVAEVVVPADVTEAATRANEIANDYYRNIIGVTPEHYVFREPIDFTPGSACERVAWSSVGSACRTEIFRRPTSIRNQRLAGEGRPEIGEWFLGADRGPRTYLLKFVGTNYATTSPTASLFYKANSLGLYDVQVYVFDPSQNGATGRPPLPVALFKGAAAPANNVGAKIVTNDAGEIIQLMPVPVNGYRFGNPAGTIDFDGAGDVRPLFVFDSDLFTPVFVIGSNEFCNRAQIQLRSDDFESLSPDSGRVIPAVDSFKFGTLGATSSGGGAGKVFDAGGYRNGLVQSTSAAITPIADGAHVVGANTITTVNGRITSIA